MNFHKNARTTPHGRDLMVRRVLDEGRTPASVATDLKSLNYHYGPKKRMIRNDLNGQ